MSLHRTFLAAVCLVSSAFGTSHPVDPFKELMVVDPTVVKDPRANPGGPWHFGTLIRRMLPKDATDAQISQFVIDWLHEFDTVTTLNGFSVPPRMGVRTRVICPWINASTGKTDCKGDLDLKKAPFRLLAISNRFDLRHTPTSKNGELQFVFAMLSKPSVDPVGTGFPTSFTALIKYELPTGSCQESHRWVNRWHKLGSLSGTEYLTSLQKITDAVTDLRENACPIPGCQHVPNQARAEIQTNDLFIGSPWQLRRFILTGCEKERHMKHAITSRTPSQTLNNSPALIEWVKKNEKAVLSGNYFLPREMLGSFANHSIGFNKWRLDGVAEETRFAFSKNTCNGCHSDESPKISSMGFFQVSTFGDGKQKLSKFILDEEIPRRKKILEQWLRRESCDVGDDHEAH